MLTRKREESIIINGDVEVQVLDITDGKVKLGIKAPKSIEILRKEVYEEIKEENKNAVRTKLNMETLKNMIKK